MLGKLLLVTGMPDGLYGPPMENVGKHLDIFDLFDLQNSCSELPLFPLLIKGAVGLLMKTKSFDPVPTICGGSYVQSPYGLNTKCFFLDAGEYKSIEMVHPDLLVTSTFLMDTNGESTLWLSHGLKAELLSYKSGQEFNASIGPDLPEGFENHCMTKINKTHVVVIATSGQTILVDIDKLTFKQGPNVEGLSSFGHYFGCAVFQHNESTHVGKKYPF